MITFTGDLYLGKHPTIITNEVKEIINSSAYVVSNFENVLANDNIDKRRDKASNLQFTKESLDSYLNNIKSKIVFTMGNNHIHDLGTEGLEDTISLLKTYSNIKYSGVGYFNDVVKPLIIDDNNKKIALLSISTDEPEVMSIVGNNIQQGVLDCNNSIIFDIIKEYKNSCDYVVIIPHWGKEYVDYPSVQQRYKAYKWIDSGADLIIGHHPHVIQGKENYNGKWIYYSLGNYIFPDFYDKNGFLHKWSSENNQSVMLKVNFYDTIKISEVGLNYDTSSFKLILNNSSKIQMNYKSEALIVDQVPIKKYFGIWQKEQFRILKKEYSLLRTFLLLFPVHEKHNRLGYIIHRIIKKIFK